MQRRILINMIERYLAKVICKNHWIEVVIELNVRNDSNYIFLYN